MGKTQILITDIPRERFDERWPQEVERRLRKEFSNVEPDYFTPLSFLDRIVIILRRERDTADVYEWLKRELVEDPIKIYLTEPLINKPRSRSAVAGRDRAGKDEDLEMDKGVLDKDGKPVLKIDISAAEGLGLGSSPKLSPEKQISPTRLRFPDDPKVYYYMEPAPERSPTGPKFSEPCSSCSNGTQYLYRGRSPSLTDKMPSSPSITLNQCLAMENSISNDP
ncbi:Rcn2p Ecym_8325 [Eremothecium cymbalariae DBVPG|uniref:Uncharacterized protein n=1 Tax=Eremothecium cymbalariae (strain CBS 270.75 / DBVPG 7215 / KCTC 17166 / NRRL Y-17582) TaxID=931890 RepID=G8JXM9_ERECY|nr:Hypothetical protein Ecym_8325 [Eremothecium cymbalariae DBVPG\